MENLLRQVRFSPYLLATESGYFFENMDGTRAAQPDDMGEAYRRAFHLPSAGLAPEMGADLIDIGNARRAKGVPFG